jgi:hypothetical protein
MTDLERLLTRLRAGLPDALRRRASTAGLRGPLWDLHSILGAVDDCLGLDAVHPLSIAAGPPPPPQRRGRDGKWRR